jgi:HlyD family secretion protein
MKRYFKLILILSCLSLSACGSSDKAEGSGKQEVMTVRAKPLETSLYYSGTVQPFKSVVVISPAEGVVEESQFHYGDIVKPGQLLFTIASEKFQTDYKNALMQYLKSKNEFDTSSSQLKEGDFLHKNQLISDDDFKTKQTSFYNAQLGLIQAKDTLSAMLKRLDVKGFKLEELTIENIEKINLAMHAQGDTQLLRVTSPVSGVILLPPKSDGGDDAKKIGKGDAVKQGDVLAVIGDISGLTIRVNVNEFNINQIKVGQKVHVTGPAFSDYVLEGNISGIDRQAQSSQGGMPTFPIEVEVPKMTPEQQAVIHAGMSAKVEINIEGPPQITVPIQAVIEKNGMTFVKVKKKFGKIQEVAVKTGQTTENEVVIESNLQEGDQVVFTR